MSKKITKKINYTFFHAILTALVCTAISNCQQCALSCLQTQNGCKVCFQECLYNGSTLYSFYSCSQTVNNKLSGVDSKQNSTQSYTYDLSGCVNQCCCDQLAKFRYPNLSYCPTSSFLSSGSKLSQILIITFCILIFLLVVICCIVSGNSNIRNKLIECLCKEIEEKVQGKSSPYQINQSINILIEVTDQSICSICLEGLNNIWTKCGHPFHINCLYEWITRKQECPLCKAKEMKKVYILCTKCHSTKAKVALKETPYFGVKRLNIFKCHKCRAVQ